MEKEELENLLIEYIDNTLSEQDRTRVEARLQSDPGVRTLYRQLKDLLHTIDRSTTLEADQEMTAQFRQKLEEARRTGFAKIVTLPGWFYKVAASLVFVLVSGGIGYWISQQQNADALRAVEQERGQIRHSIVAKLEDELSAGQRMLGVKAALDVERVDDEIVQVLIKVMNEDSNSNVRLAAIDALSRFQEEESVRKALIASLLLQKDPVVQMALIRVMVQMKETDAVKPLQKIIEDETILPAVKDEAYSGMWKLEFDV